MAIAVELVGGPLDGKRMEHVWREPCIAVTLALDEQGARYATYALWRCTERGLYLYRHVAGLVARGSKP